MIKKHFGLLILFLLSSISADASWRSFPVSSGAVSERVERIHVGGASASTDCSASPCSQYQESGDWVSTVTYSATGNYTVNFTAGTFSAAPDCVCSAFSSVPSRVGCATTTATSSSASANCWNAGGDKVCYFDMICVGPR